MNSVELAKTIRENCLKLSHQWKSSHLGGCFSIADVLAVLYSDILKYDPKNPMLDTRDRLFYGKGHAAMALYTCLEGVGFYQNLAQEFTKNGSIFTSHVNHKVPGIEISTGSLGHALSVACGAALFAKTNAKPWNVYCVLSDGELDEGSVWEAILFAGHHHLDNLTVIVDYNKIQSFGSVKEVLDLDPLADKFSSFRFDVSEVDGHDHDALKKVFSSGRETRAEKPKAVIAHTVKGKGVSFMEHKLEWHYKSPDENQLRLGLQELQGK